jgi:hypothetical protein
MIEISAKSVSDVHGIIQNYEIENNSKFRVVKKDINFGNNEKGIQCSGNCRVVTIDTGLASFSGGACFIL